jgi:MFS family permease
VFICVMIPSFGSPSLGKLADRYGARWPSLVCFAAMVPLVVCLRFVTDDSTGHKVLLCALLTLLGITLLANTPLMAEITYAIDAREASQPGIWGDKGVYGIAYGLFTTAFALGGTVGALMAGYIVAGPGWSTMTWAVAIWCAAGVPVAFFLGGKPNLPSQASQSPIPEPTVAADNSRRDGEAV